MGGVLIIAALTLTACDNFLDAKETCNQIQSAIAYNNASSYRILVTAEKDSGIIRKPITGEVSKKVTDTFDIKFEPNDDFSFMGWNAYSEQLQQNEDINDYIEFEDSKAPETKVTLKKALNGIVIMAVCPHYPFTDFTLTGSNGKFSPSKGNYTCVMSHTYNLSFEPDMDWEFIRWQIYNKNTDEEIPNGKYIKIQNLLEENTTYSLVCPAEDDQISLGIRPIVTERPQILSYSPILSNELAYKDTTIQVIFDHDMDKKSIYYDKNERDELTKKYKDITQFLSTDVNGKECFYGYERNGQKYFKNVMIQNNKSGANLNNYFTAPTFEGDRILTISTIADKQNLFDNYTQILVILEKDFFYEKYGKPITMDSSKKWIYQVSAQTDSAGPIISAPAQDFSLKVYEKNGLKTITSKAAAPAMTLEAVSQLNVISQDKLNLNVKITDTGCGPARTFDVILKRIDDQNYKEVTAPSVAGLKSAAAIVS